MRRGSDELPLQEVADPRKGATKHGIDTLLKAALVGHAADGRGLGEVEGAQQHHRPQAEFLVARWVLVVGLEYEPVLDRLRRLLILDPGGPAPTVAAWNGVVAMHGAAGRYPFRWTAHRRAQRRFRRRHTLYRVPCLPVVRRLPAPPHVARGS